MRTRLIKYGDGYAVRIPKSYVEEAGLPKSFNLVVSGGKIELRRYKNPRYGWVRRFREAIREHGNELTAEDIEWLNAPMGPPPPATAVRTKPKRRSRPTASRATIQK